MKFHTCDVFFPVVIICSWVDLTNGIGYSQDERGAVRRDKRMFSYLSIAGSIFGCEMGFA